MKKPLHPATILMAEDEPLLREFVSAVLEGAGYRVLVGSDGLEAHAIWKREKKSIDLLLTDVVMPNGVSGIDLARLLWKDRPGLKVIYTSGQPAEAVESEVREKEGRWFLPKPYATKQLIELVVVALAAGTAD